MTTNLDLSVILFIDSAMESHLRDVVQQVQAAFDELDVRHEIIVVTDNIDSARKETSAVNQLNLVEIAEKQYGDGVRRAFAAASGSYLLTLDVDQVQPQKVLQDLWAHRNEAEIIIASRYTKGSARPPLFTWQFVSWLANAFITWSLSLPARDISSGIRLYKAAALRGWVPRTVDRSLLLELLVWAFTQGWEIQEIPATSTPHKYSFGNISQLGVQFARTFRKLWGLRNSILSADYDARAYNSRIPLQRYWQRKRFQYITELTPTDAGPVLDVGCGSSFIIQALPERSVALDILIRKLRFARHFGKHMVLGSGFTLPFPNESFHCVVCSQVVEHVPKDSPILDELCRVLSPGGRLVLGTPDYDNWEWVVIEKLYGWAAPGAYADEHITHYSQRELKALFEARGYRVEATRYILHGELIMAFRKPA